MNLTKEQQDILDGKQGDVLAKVMQTLVRYGEVFGADAMVPVTSKYNHLVTSFGLKALAPVYELMDKLIESGNVSKQKFSADPRPLDPNVPSSFLQNFVFKNFMYSKQEDYEKQLEQIGIMDKDAYTCTCYMDEVGNTPAMGEVLSIVFAMITIASSSAGRIAEILQEKTDIANPENPVMYVADGEINYNNVEFVYASKADKKVLSNINLHIASGETLGIIGGTGYADCLVLDDDCVTFHGFSF